jgi:hypothetical protein
MKRPKIEEYIKQDPSELTTGEILIGSQKYAKALDSYINKQLILSGVSISDSLDIKIKTIEHVDELIDQKAVGFKNIPELQKERIELNAQIKLLRHLKNN